MFMSKQVTAKKEQTQAELKAELKALVSNVMGSLYKWAGISLIEPEPEPEPTPKPRYRSAKPHKIGLLTCRDCGSEFEGVRQCLYCKPCSAIRQNGHSSTDKERELQRQRLIDYVADLILARDKRAALERAHNQPICLSWLHAEYERQEIATDGKHLLIAYGRGYRKILMQCGLCAQTCPPCGYAPLYQESRAGKKVVFVLLCRNCYDNYGRYSASQIVPVELLMPEPTDFWNKAVYQEKAIARLARIKLMHAGESGGRKTGARFKGSHSRGLNRRIAYRVA